MNQISWKRCSPWWHRRTEGTDKRMEEVDRRTREEVAMRQRPHRCGAKSWCQWGIRATEEISRPALPCSLFLGHGALRAAAAPINSHYLFLLLAVLQLQGGEGVINGGWGGPPPLNTWTVASTGLTSCTLSQHHRCGQSPPLCAGSIGALQPGPVTTNIPLHCYQSAHKTPLLINFWCVSCQWARQHTS